MIPAPWPEALRFFALLTVELVLLYGFVSFGVELLQAWLGEDRLRAVLGGRARFPGLLMAAGLGIITPFCSCSTVPVVAGMDRAGVAWPMTATFLVISPLVNPALFTLMWGLVSPSYAALYVVASLAIALLVGAIIALAGWSSPPAPSPADQAACRQEACGKDPCRQGACGSGGDPGWDVKQGLWDAVVDTRRLVPLFVLAAAIGAGLKHWVGTGWITGVLDAAGWWSVPVAALLGLPVYASTAVLLPLGALLLQQGIDLGVVTAFLMGATGFSVPEGLMLKGVIGPRRLAILGAAFVPAVVAIGYGFQLIAF